MAIKHIIKDEQMETFVREVTSLSHIKHPNLVSLLGHYDGPNECFLVYELCHNGNLSEWLFGMFLDFDIWDISWPKLYSVLISTPLMSR